MNVLAVLDATHRCKREEQTKVLNPVIKSLTEPEKGVHCTEDYDHSFPHGCHPKHIPVAETSDQEEEDRGVSEDPEYEMDQHLIPSKLLKV
jgi:hypothetical protein